VVVGAAVGIGVGTAAVVGRAVALAPAVKGFTMTFFVVVADDDDDGAAV
jgi:hypothetical protein